MADQPTVDSADRRRRSRRRLRRILIAVTVTLLGLAALVPAGRLLLVHRYDQAITKATLLSPSARATSAVTHASVTGPLNFLLVGSDRRADDPAEGQRSDTIIIAHVSTALDQVSLVSVPRDLFVDIPADRTLNFGGATAKINAAFQFGGGGNGGTRLLSQTLTELMGIRFNGAVVVDFAGLEHAVDLVGGVPMCIDEPAVSVHTGQRFAAGCEQMNGAVALDYIRQRYQFKEGDFARQLHQQEFLKAFFGKVLSIGVLANPLTLDNLLRSVAGAMIVDTGNTTVPDLVYALRGLRPGDLGGVKLPYYLDTVDKQSIVRASDDANGLYQALRTDSVAAWTREHPQWVNEI